MQSNQSLLWACLSLVPVALVYGSAWARLSHWLRGAVGGRSASAPAIERRRPSRVEPILAPASVEPARTQAASLQPIEPKSGEQSLIDEMLSHSRYTLLLRPQIVGNLTADQHARTREALAEAMCIVPAGEVLLRPPMELDDRGDRIERAQHHGIPLRVAAYYLDRYPVTNAQFQQFVANGGYEQMAIWDQEILPAVLDFVDQTGHPGPRYWREGRYLAGEANHPVVGVCWYEAWAYARWAGKRLPSDAEWVKAGSWPVALPGHPIVDRAYPWGDAMDCARANLWASGYARTVSIKHFPGGVSVGGAHQLIGNVWEWTADDFSLEDLSGELNVPRQAKMKSLHGGAFDTYLDTQATCQFQSGDLALARKHNVGFRCAIGMCDLISGESPAEPDCAVEQATELPETI